MNPANRIFRLVTIEDALEANEIFKTLMGKDVDIRKEFIIRHPKEVTNLDILKNPPQDSGTLTHRVEPVSIEQEMKVSYINYAMSVIIGRAIPDARDGL